MIRILLVASLLAGCHSEEADNKKKPADKTPTVAHGDQGTPEAYKRDVDRFCNAERLADALHIETSARGLIVAEWLSKNLETPKARQFLASLTTLSATEKAARLNAEGKSAGLASCPTADTWTAEAKRTATP